MKLNIINILKKTSLGLLVCSVIFVIALLGSAKVTLTPSGSYYKLYVFGKVSLKLFNSGVAQQPNFKQHPFAAPIVELSDDLTGSKNAKNTVHWYCLNQAYTQQVSASKIAIDCQGNTYTYQWNEKLEKVVIEQDVLAEKTLVLSDIHGDIDYLDSILIQMNIVNEHGQWQWGTNQIVVTGDSVDKGPADFRVLWRLYQLSQQAKKTGGDVHVLIGNHEHYQLRGNHSRLNADMRVKTFAMTKNLTGTNSPYSQKTLLGQWLRSRPAIIRIGKYLFTHGGLSKSHLNSKYSLLEINESVREYYSQNRHSALKPSKKLSLALSLDGLIWFRGQLRENKENTPSSKELATILKKYGAEVLVIGHSSVDSLEPLVDNQVWPVHSDHRNGQVLLIEQGKATMRKLAVKWYDYNFVRHETRASKRPLRIFDSNAGKSELSVVEQMFLNMQELQKRTNSY